MKRSILTLSLIAILSLTATSCSTDDSALDNKENATDYTLTPGDGTKDLPRPTGPRL
jgi:hypothetical protein